MSLSPSKMDARKPSKSASSEPLTLPQALLITAGLAGLVGLCGGAFLRFSLAKSPNASFLSPLQTFPALSNWTPELPQETADSHSLPGGGDESEEGGNRAKPTILTFEPAAPVDRNQRSPISDSLNTEITVDSESTDTATFDAFAARGNGRQRTAAPLELLKKGPDLGGLRSRNPSQSDGGLPYGESSQGDVYDDSEGYADKSDSSYNNGDYNNGDYNDSYEDNYYPPTDEPIDSSDAYYDGEQW